MFFRESQREAYIKIWPAKASMWCEILYVTKGLIQSNIERIVEGYAPVAASSRTTTGVR